MIQRTVDIWGIFPLAGRMFTKEKEKADNVTAALQNREMKAETYISSLEIMLFHCRTKEVNHCRFGYIGFREPFSRKDGTGWVKGAVVMLTPEYGTAVCLEVMSTISSVLIENTELITYLHRLDQEAFVLALEKYLGQYYQKTLYHLHHLKKIL